MALTAVSTSDASYARLPVFPASPTGAAALALELRLRESSGTAGESGMLMDGIDSGTSTAIGARSVGRVDDVREALLARTGAADGSVGGMVT